MKWQEDKFTRMAREKGYPARSVFKLEEIQNRYSIIKKGARVLDIGAAPGSWSLYVLNTLKSSCTLVAVDLKDLSPRVKSKNPLTFIRGNILEEKTLSALVSLGPFSLILSDVAPSTTGDRIVDTARSLELSEKIISIAESLLDKGGTIVLKIFQGEESQSLLDRMIRLFGKAKAFKPNACKKGSMETYFIGFDYSGVSEQTGEDIR